jgi:hypothetical protein
MFTDTHSWHANPDRILLANSRQNMIGWHHVTSRDIETGFEALGSPSYLSASLGKVMSKGGDRFL